MTTEVINQNAAALVKIPRKSKKVEPPQVYDDASPSRFSTLTAEVLRLNREVAVNGYRMGVILRELRDAKLYAHGAFESYDKYLESIAISPKWAGRLIEIAKAYTEIDFLEVGVKKLSIIVQAAPEQRTALLDQARAGTSKRELERQIIEANKRRAEEIRSKGGKVDSQLGTGNTAAPTMDSKRITMVKREGIFGHDLTDQKTDQAATLETLAKGPAFTTIQFENGSTQLVIVYLDPKTGTLKLKETCERRK